jgi:mannitol/fructose-specific phosphotransferase system IIA component (Ntr-type)
MQLRQLVSSDLVFTDLHCGDHDSVLRAMAGLLESRHAVPDADALYAKLMEREALGSTAIGKGVAIPHCKLAELDRVVLAVGVTRDGIDLATPDGEPVRLFFLVASPEGSPAEHLQSLAAISKWLKEPSNLERLRRARTQREVYESLRGGEESARG